jgi:hypothetical protein
MLVAATVVITGISLWWQYRAIGAKPAYSRKRSPFCGFHLFDPSAIFRPVDLLFTDVGKKGCGQQ